KTEKHLFQGNREEVRQQSVQTALLALKELLK
ncbi:MAG: damage-inducible protein CinA, partial [Methylophilaceae bacterium]|nr:damage-inducible protein CinA [Methylophilaceae bacterium]